MGPDEQQLWLPVDLRKRLLLCWWRQRRRGQGEDPSPGLRAQWEEWKRKPKLDARRWAER